MVAEVFENNIVEEKIELDLNEDAFKKKRVIKKKLI
jgi:hypothetical protein